MNKVKYNETDLVTSLYLLTVQYTRFRCIFTYSPDEERKQNFRKFVIS